MLDIEVFVEKKNALYGDAFLLLVEIEYSPGEYLRWAAVDSLTEGAVTFESQAWEPFAVGKPRRSQNSSGQIPTFDLPIGNPERVFTSVLESYVVEGRQGRLITVHRDHLDDPTAKAEEWFTIEMISDVTAAVINVTCKAVRFNPRRCRIPSRTMTRKEYPGLLGSNRHRFS